MFLQIQEAIPNLHPTDYGQLKNLKKKKIIPINKNRNNYNDIEPFSDQLEINSIGLN